MQDLKKLHWKCHRGMKEMDILFEHYLYQYYEDADIEHQRAFETMCDMQDPVIADYLFARRHSHSKQVDNIIKIMRLYRVVSH
ncbi:MAG: FAD assembly factor SdhE [Ostreibacterium sp.]